MAHSQYGQPTIYAFADIIAAEHSTSHRFNNPKRFQALDRFYHWARKRLPSPGVQNYAFESLGLPEFNPIGPSVAARSIIRTLAGPQQYLPASAIPIAGIGGLAAGQVILQALYDPNTNSYGGVPLE